MRHLTMRQAEDALVRVKGIEQLLARQRNADGRWTVSWMVVVPAEGGFRVTLHRVVEPPTVEIFDVADFPPLDEEERVGEGRCVDEVDAPGPAMAGAGAHGAVPDRWVNLGLIDQEYADAVSGSG
jgi:hypothetical protein